MTYKLTQEQLTAKVWNLLAPEQSNEAPMLKLLRVLASQQPSAPMPMQPAGQVKQPAPPTLENIAATTATSPNPKAPDYPFIKRK